MAHRELSGVQGNKQIEEPRSGRTRRAGRGRLVSVDSWAAKGKSSRASELDPESTIASDQVLTEIAQRSANSESSTSIQRSNQQAADDIEHIFCTLPENDRRLLERVLEVGQGGSLRETAANVGVYAAQLSRAYEATRRAHKWQVFQRSRRNIAPPARTFVEYRPRVVPMELVMMIHQGPTLSAIGPDPRTSKGLNLVSEVKGARKAGPPPDNPCTKQDGAKMQESGDGTAGKLVNPCSESNECKHTDRQWLKAGFADLRLTCLTCRTELAQVNPFAQKM
jgi:hypothetical protein